jgi:hypothetical protein
MGMLKAITNRRPYVPQEYNKYDNGQYTAVKQVFNNTVGNHIR